MDGHRFDDLSRKLASSASRRATLFGAAVGLLAALGPRSAAEAQVSQAQCGNKRCANDPGVCNDGCVCCVYSNGNSRCRPPGSCGPGEAVCPAGKVVDLILGCVSIATGDGSLDESDPTFFFCDRDYHYDAYIFQHAGGPLSLSARGLDSGGGTLPDPFIVLYAGAGVPADPCAERLTLNDDGGCRRDAYLETTQPAGTYTAIVLETFRETGTYTFERDTFTPSLCP